MGAIPSLALLIGFWLLVMVIGESKEKDAFLFADLAFGLTIITFLLLVWVFKGENADAPWKVYPLINFLLTPAAWAGI